MTTLRKRPTQCGLAASLAIAALGGALLGAFADIRPAQAVIVLIEYYDRGFVNPEFAGGPLWTGKVDTTANTLTIETWTELPLHGSEFWIPENLPMAWPARNSSGGLFDVPDSFDGHIDNSFAFISDLTLRQMSWSIPHFDYTTTPPTVLPTTPGVYTDASAEIRPGWGGFAFGPPGATANSSFIFRTSNPLHTTNPDNSAVQPVFDERIMPKLPVSAIATTWSEDALVSASFPATAAVPEARAWLLVSAAIVVTAGLSWRRRLGY